MLEKITIERQKEIEKEVFGDTKKYLENCLNNYSEYVSVAQKLFPAVYNKIGYYDQKYKILEHLAEYDNAIKANNIDLQIILLKREIERGIYTPGTYERIAKTYEKNNDIESAYKACIAWFKTDFWKLPNTADGSLRILKRLERLEKKYPESGASRNNFKV
jgi:tetratricopeptide (TPR) repeat protein